MRLRFLGGFELHGADGAILSLVGQKDRALLAAVALGPPGGQRREWLASLLWGDLGERLARDSLKHSLNRLRQALGGALEADREVVRLSPQVDVDVWQLRNLVDVAADEALKRSAALYRGELLEGIVVRGEVFEDWLRAERQSVKEVHDRLLNRLIDELSQQGALGDAADAARLILSRDPLQEGAARALMRFHQMAGRSAEALRVYEDLQCRLKAELDVTPEPETAALAEAIRSRRIPAATAERNSIGADQPAVAVLPFENLGEDPAQQYFSDGITEDIITELGRFRPFRVMSRHSSFAFRGRQQDVQAAARELGVCYVVSGSIRRFGERIRISAQLSEAASGAQLWAERYDRDAHDIFEVQDEVARAVAAAAFGRVDAMDRNRVLRLSPDGLRAYDLVLQAKAFTMNYTRADNRRALLCAEHAMSLDPSNARAHAHAAWCHFYDYMAVWRPKPRDSFQLAYDLARRGASLDEMDSFPRTILGIMQIFRREYEHARENMLSAVALNPSDFLARRFYGVYLVVVGEAESGIAEIEMARGLNPFDTRWVPWNLGIACFSARRYDDAIAALTKAYNPINEVPGLARRKLCRRGADRRGAGNTGGVPAGGRDGHGRVSWPAAGRLDSPTGMERSSTATKRTLTIYLTPCGLRA